MTLRDFEFQARGHYLLEVLAEARGVVVEAARIAGVSRQQFYKLMVDHGIPRNKRNSHFPVTKVDLRFSSAFASWR